MGVFGRQRVVQVHVDKSWLENSGVPGWSRDGVSGGQRWWYVKWLKSGLEIVVLFQVLDRGCFSGRWCHVAFFFGGQREGHAGSYG